MKAYRSVLVGAAALAFLVACGSLLVFPQQVTVNGYRVELDGQGRPTGKVDLSVSALDSLGQLISTARIRDVKAEVMATNAGIDFEIAGGVCGDITASEGAMAVVLMLDETGSMLDFDPRRVRFDAARRFVERIAARDVANVSRFSGGVRTTPGLLTAEVMQDFTSDTDLLHSVIDTTYLASGWTPLWDASHDAVTLLRNRPEPNRIALIMTDGINNRGRHTVDSVVPYAIDSRVQMFIAGFGDANSGELNRLADRTMGFAAITDVAKTEEEALEEGAKLVNLFNNIFNATQAQGCIDLIFSPTPMPGTNVEGTVTLRFDFNSISSMFDIRF